MIDPRTTIHEFMVSHQKKYQKISMEIHEHPEGSDFEFLASKLLSEQKKDLRLNCRQPGIGLVLRQESVFPKNDRSLCSWRNMMHWQGSDMAAGIISSGRLLPWLEQPCCR